MKILVVGGGTGGHVTPAIAVVNEILKLKPRTEVRFWSDRKYYSSVVKITTLGGIKMRVQKVPAGKFRRYTHIRGLAHLKLENWDIVGKNIVDFFRVVWAVTVSVWRLLWWRPDAVFLKGGYVSLPVGVAAKWLRIPYVIHDSDATLGLTSRMLERRAALVALGMPSAMTERSQHDKYIWTGIPVAESFRRVTAAEKRKVLAGFDLSPSKPMVLVTGGSSGSRHMNDATEEILGELLKFASVVLVAGRNNYQVATERLKRYEVWQEGEMQSDFRLFEFRTDMDKLMMAATVVVSRAGATTIAEMAAMGKACVLVPYGVLPGGHQSKNAAALVAEGAAEMVEDEEMVKRPERLLELVRGLVRNEKKRKLQEENLYKLARHAAAKDLAEAIIRVAAKAKSGRGAGAATK
jgi:UDP-N-acetylglucosamine--N-acetylmuramyl-(pentapeptide) pyrophosphoryl-undecaprenol N-acetylglucosamine transferase